MKSDSIGFLNVYFVLFEAVSMMNHVPKFVTCIAGSTAAMRVRAPKCDQQRRSRHQDQDQIRNAVSLSTSQISISTADLTNKKHAADFRSATRSFKLFYGHVPILNSLLLQPAPTTQSGRESQTLWATCSRRRSAAPAVKPGRSVGGERANFTRLVLGCIEAELCK